MNTESRTSFWGTALLSGLLATAVAGCIVTAFDIPLQNGMGAVAMWCALFALGAAFLFHIFRGLLPFSLLPAGLLLVLMQGTGQPLQMQTILPHITQFYHRAYGWPILLGNPETAEYADLVILRLALILCFFLCWTLSRQKKLVWCLLPLAPTLCCVVVYDTVPSAGWLGLLLFGGILLVLTHFSRRKGGSSWNQLAVYLSPAVALFLAILFVLVPPAKGLNPLRQISDRLLPQLQGWLTQTGPGSSGD